MTGWWAQPYNAQRRHFFPGKDKPSLCGKFLPPKTDPARGRSKCIKCLKAGAK